MFYSGHSVSPEIYPKDLLQPCSGTALGKLRGCNAHMDKGLPANSTIYAAATITETGGAWPPTRTTRSPLVEVTPTKPLVLRPPLATTESTATKGVVSFSYVVLAPALGGTPWFVLGELEKVVPVSPTRFGDLTTSGSTLTWELSGESDEEVTISYAQAGKFAGGLKSVTCLLKNLQPTRAGPGAATLSCSLPSGCTCA